MIANSMENVPTRTPIKLVVPNYDSELTDLVISLNSLQTQDRWEGTTPESLFKQFQTVLFMVESVATARIEGNHTTILEYINSKIDNKRSNNYGIREINNLLSALKFIEENGKTYPLNRLFVSQLHKIVMDGVPLDEEGDLTPGEYRKENVAIINSEHRPPDAITVNDYMADLFDFVAKPVQIRYELLKTAIAHHRFVWIHPFTNGNGRTARLFTYAMLVRSGFAVESGRIVNPAAVFCSTRKEYYKYLEEADKSVNTGNDEGMLHWCEYMLSGLKKEMDNLSRLTNYNFVKTNLLHPMLKQAKVNKTISANEYRLLENTLDKQPFQAAEVKDVFADQGIKNTSLYTTRIIRSLREKNMLVPTTPNGRSYYIQMDNNPLLRELLFAMDDAGMIPIDPKS